MSCESDSASGCKPEAGEQVLEELALAFARPPHAGAVVRIAPERAAQHDHPPLAERAHADGDGAVLVARDGLRASAAGSSATHLSA